MKKLIIGLLLCLLSQNAFAWDSESGLGVVSANENIVRSSLEALLVLQSDTASNLYGVTFLGGTANYTSFDSGGVESFRNVVGSVDVVKLNSNQYFTYRMSTGREVRAGVSADNVYSIGVAGRADTKFNFIGTVSAVDATVTKLAITSLNATDIRVSGTLTRTSTYTAGTCVMVFNNGLLTSATC